MTAHRYLCFVHGDAWIYTKESGTIGPITTEDDLSLPLAPNTEVPDVITTGHVQTGKRPLTREEFYKLREEIGLQHGITLLLGIASGVLLGWLIGLLL